MSGSPRFSHPLLAGRGAGPRHAGVPLSMIDVVFLLLIFLLLGQFPLAEGLLSMPLAGEGGAAEQLPPTLWIQVMPDGRGGCWYLLNDEEPTQSADVVLARVRARARIDDAARLAVVVGADEGVPFEKMVELWEGCRGLGVRKLAMPAGEPPAGQR